MIKLLNNLENYDIDIEPIMDRFMGDENLYYECFEMFMEDVEFGNLYSALIKKEYGAAFDSAHNLKGVSANLGLTTLYKIICELVEKLRYNDYKDLLPIFERIVVEKEKLANMA